MCILREIVTSEVEIGYGKDEEVLSKVRSLDLILSLKFSELHRNLLVCFRQYCTHRFREERGYRSYSNLGELF